MLERLQHHDRSAVRQHESVAVLVERTARRLGRVVSAGERLHVRERRHGESGDGRLGSAGDHHVRQAVPNEVERLADRMRRGGAGGDGGEVGALEAVADGDQPGGDVRNEHRDEERGDPIRPLGDVGPAVVLVGLHPADAAPDHHTGAVGRGRVTIEPGLGDRLVGRPERELREEVVPPRFLLVHVEEGIEALDLAGEPDGELRGVELADRCRSRRPRQERGPRGVDVIPHRCHQPEAGDDDTTRQFTSRSSRAGNSWRHRRCAASRHPRRGCRYRTPSRRP